MAIRTWLKSRIQAQEQQESISIDLPSFLKTVNDEMGEFAKSAA